MAEDTISEEHWEGVAPAANESEAALVAGFLQSRGIPARVVDRKRIARELKMRRNTVRRYLKGGESAEMQVRPGARRLGDGERREAEELFTGEAAGNAVVVRELLAKRGVLASISTVQRAVLEKRRRLRAEALATVRAAWQRRDFLPHQLAQAQGGTTD